MRSVRAKLFIAFMVATLSLPAAIAFSSPIDEQLNTIDEQLGQKKEQVKSTQGQLDTLRTDLDGLVREYQDASIKLQEIDESIAKKQRELNSAVEQQIFYQKILNKLSVFTYRDGDVYFFEVVLGTRTFKDLIVRLDYLTKLSQRQAEILKAAKKLREVVQDGRDHLSSEKARQKELVLGLQAKQDGIARILTEEQALLNSLGSDIQGLEADKVKKVEEKAALEARAKQPAGAAPNATIDIGFPIPFPHAHGYINDWGFARAGNRSGHQGTDVFAVKGTPLVAVTDGVIGEDFGFIRIGGFRLHVVADNGVHYYYAHLNNDTPGTDDGLGGAATAYAPGIAPGVRVKRGQVIGFVGDSGDAEPTPPHLHFGIIAGNWVNPFPYLKATDWK